MLLTPPPSPSACQGHRIQVREYHEENGLSVLVEKIVHCLNCGGGGAPRGLSESQRTIVERFRREVKANVPLYNLESVLAIFDAHFPVDRLAPAAGEGTVGKD